MSSTKISNKGWFRVFIVIPAFFIFTIVFQVLALGISFFLSGAGLIEEFTLDQLDSFDNLPVMTIIQYVDMVGIFLLLWIFMKFIDKEPFMNMGFSVKGKRNDIILGMTLGLFMMALGYIVLESLGEIQFSRINLDHSYIIRLFILFIVGIMLLTEGGHLAHLKLFGEDIVPMSKTNFYFIIAILVLIDIVQGRYQKKIMKSQEGKA